VYLEIKPGDNSLQWIEHDVRQQVAGERSNELWVVDFIQRFVDGFIVIHVTAQLHRVTQSTISFTKADFGIKQFQPLSFQKIN